MIDMSLFTVSLASGALLGLVFFWGLWATVKQLGQKRHPVLMILGSLILRFGLVLCGFYLLAHHGGWQQVLSAAIGFTLIRVIIVHRLQSVTPVTNNSKKESAA